MNASTFAASTAYYAKGQRQYAGYTQAQVNAWPIWQSAGVPLANLTPALLASLTIGSNPPIPSPILPLSIAAYGKDLASVQAAMLASVPVVAQSMITEIQALNPPFVPTPIAPGTLFPTGPLTV